MVLGQVLAGWPLPPGSTLLVVAVGLGLIVHHFSLQRPLPAIPYRKEGAHTFWGDINAMRALHPDLRREWLAQLPAKLASPVVQVFFEPFCRPWVFVADAREARDIAERRLDEFDRAYRNYEYFGPVLPEHHITMRSTDPRFHYNKKLVGPLMRIGFLHDVSTPQIYEKTMALVKLWDLKARLAAGRPFEAAQDIWRSALDIILVVAFGLDPSRTAIAAEAARLAAEATQRAPDDNDDDDNDRPKEFGHAPLSPELDAFVTMTEAVALSMASAFPLVAHWLFRWFSPRMRAAAKAKDRLVRTEIALSVDRLTAEGRIGDGVSGGSTTAGSRLRCAMDQLLVAESAQARDQGREPDFYSKTIQDELVGYLIAGHDTSSTTLAWFAKFISAHQDVQERLRNELRAAHAAASKEGRAPTCAEIRSTSIPYLDAVEAETLRKASPIPSLIRQATRDTEILGYPIPKGTNVVLLVNGPSIAAPAFAIDETKRSTTARDAKSKYGQWDDRDIGLFNPDRWLRTETTTRDDGTTEQRTVFNRDAGPSLPFGAGRRGCFGKELAKLELKTMITMMVWHFAFDGLPENLADMMARAHMTTVPKQCFVQLRRV